MKRATASILVALLLLALLPVSVSGCGYICACLPPPSGWTPPPVDQAHAAAYAAKFADVPAMYAWLTGTSSRTYRATTDGALAVDALAFVDAESGAVLDMVRQDRLPVDDRLPIAEAGARTAAEGFLARVGLSTAGLTESVDIVRQSGVAAYQVDWSDASGRGSFRVLINGSTAAVFAYIDLRAEPGRKPPLIGKGRAVALAIAAAKVPGETVTSLYFDSDQETWWWNVGLGAPSASDPNVFENGVMRIDAKTGEATVSWKS